MSVSSNLQNIAATRRKLMTLGVFNFLFVAAYAVIGVHALFLHQGDSADLRKATVLGMSLFSGTQVGGVWILSLLRYDLSRSKLLLALFRLIAAALIVVPNAASIVAGMAFFGLSHSIYYVRSRALLARMPEVGAKGYALFGITTNLAFLTTPLFGTLLLNFAQGKVVAALVSTLFGALSLWMLHRAEVSHPELTTPEKSKGDAATAQPEISLRMYLADMARFLGFIVPYAVIMAILPIQLSAEGYSANMNAYAVAANGVIVVLFQSIYFMTGKKTYSTALYDKVSLLAMILLGVAMVSPLNILGAAFLVWCFCEAYQLPAIEYHLFSKRGYSGKPLNRILAIDAVICFAGPIIAESSRQLWKAWL